MKFRTAATTVSALLLVIGCAQRDATTGLDAPALAAGLTAEDLEARLAQFVPSQIDFDDSTLQPWEREVLAKLIEASDIMHELFLLQVSPRNPVWRAALAGAADTREGRAARDYAEVMAGPWDRLEENEPFLDVGPKPPGAGYYPPDLTSEEIDEWLASHPEDREAFSGYFSVIERDKGMLVAIPYNVEYRDRLEVAAAVLNEAADIAQNASLAEYLRARAASFLSNDYFPSDMAWMDIEGTRIEPTIGPYEVYEDQLMGWKAAFESFVTVADPAASAELDELKDSMRHLEENLPIEDRYKNLERGFESPIRVVDVVYTAGDTRAGVQTIAFNLPNDERVRAAKGSKKVMLRNVARAKFDAILMPIARQVLMPEVADDLTFDAWFTNVLMHELAHGLGPGFIVGAGGDTTTVNQALRDHYSAMEEAKADVTGLHNMTVLAADGMYDEAFVRRAFIGHVADMFRATRFGATEAHGLANLIQFNWMVERGAIEFDEGSGNFKVNYSRLVDANRELAMRILTIQAQGDHAAAGALLQRYGTVSPQMRAAIEQLESVPVDIRPIYPGADRLRPR
ncbi:MAG TPA: hypothetical protein VMN78_12945 [Longimicrobiales bacterium]|nr:hypothetical protein [Longimicrobiales bacterium]